jgi:hypothetical protein
MAQTTVDWLIEKFKELEADFKYSIIDYETYKSKQMSLLEQSKKMFEEQVIEAYRMGRTDQQSDKKTGTYNRMAKQYFDETFKSK